MTARWFRRGALEGNFVVSPLATAEAMAVLGSGAAGPTREHFERVLGTTSVPALLTELEALHERRSADGALAVRASLEVAQRVEFSRRFRAGAQRLVEWSVRGQQEGNPPLVGQVAARLQVQMQLRAGWRQGFEWIEDGPFESETGPVVRHRMRHLQWVRLHETDLATRFSLLLDARQSPERWTAEVEQNLEAGESEPDESGWWFTVVVPRQGISLASLESAIPTELEAWLDEHGASSVVRRHVTLPPFAIPTVHADACRLFDRGPAHPCSNAADLTAMASAGQPRLRVDSIATSTDLRADETSVTATASVVALVSIAVGVHDEPELVVDRPFLFFIHDRTDGSVLLAGRVSDPQGVDPPAVSLEDEGS